ncbi:MAG: HEAT repeat domain-containing protein, partial [Rhodothermales bacterium]
DEDALQALRAKWGNGEMKGAILLIEAGLAQGNAAARNALRGSVAAGLNYRRAAKTLVPLIRERLRAADPDARRHAADVLAKVGNHTKHLARTIPLLADCLRGELREVRAAAHTLLQLRRWGHDITKAVTDLQATLNHPDTMCRAYASWALTEHYIRTGVEKRLDSWVAAPHPRASYRRTYARSDTEIEEEDLTGGSSCRVCKSERTRCIWFEVHVHQFGDVFETEYLCLDCGKYSIYHQER